MNLKISSRKKATRIYTVVSVYLSFSGIGRNDYYIKDMNHIAFEDAARSSSNCANISHESLMFQDV